VDSDLALGACVLLHQFPACRVSDVTPVAM